MFLCPTHHTQERIRERRKEEQRLLEERHLIEERENRLRDLEEQAGIHKQECEERQLADELEKNRLLGPEEQAQTQQHRDKVLHSFFQQIVEGKRL